MPKLPKNRVRRYLRLSSGVVCAIALAFCFYVKVVHFYDSKRGFWIPGTDEPVEMMFFFDEDNEEFIANLTKELRKRIVFYSGHRLGGKRLKYIMFNRSDSGTVARLSAEIQEKMGLDFGGYIARNRNVESTDAFD